MHNDLLIAIREFLTRTGTTPYNFGMAAARNGKLVERLEENRRVWPETEQAIRSFLEENQGRTDPVIANRSAFAVKRERRAA